MMLDENGRFYIVDFGNSTLVSEVAVGDEEWLATKQEDEVKAAKLVVRSLLVSYQKLKLQAA